MPQYQTPGVYVEEISSGPRPVQASSTTETGIVGMITIPKSFLDARRSRDMLVPQREDHPALSWQRAVAFYALPGDEEPRAEGKAADAKPADAKPAEAKADPKGAEKPSDARAAAARHEPPRLNRMVKDLLGARWDVSPPDRTGTIALTDGKQIIRFNARSTLIAERGNDHTFWDIAAGANALEVVNLVAAHAQELGIPYGGELACVSATPAATHEIQIEAVHDRLMKTASRVTSLDGFEGWLDDFARDLFVNIYLEANAQASEAVADAA